MTMNRMDLAQLVYFFRTNKMPACVDYFKSLANESITVGGLIEADFVKRHCSVDNTPAQIWKEIQANVTTYVGCEF